MIADSNNREEGSRRGGCCREGYSFAEPDARIMNLIEQNREPLQAASVTAKDDKLAS